MFKNIVSILLLFLSLLFAQQGSIEGVVKDSRTGQPLAGADIVLQNMNRGTISGKDGKFLISGLNIQNVTLIISYLGYKNSEETVLVPKSGSANLTILLTPTTLLGKEVVVVATRAVEGETPAAFTTLRKKEIETRYFAQDIPVMLSELPSTTSYSESGNGVGYNYLSIRGFGQRRISVMINGVPQNDPEDHNVYWVDFPDLLGNVEDIQVQRGAGNAFYGPPAIGGSVNIVTSHFSQNRGVSAYAGSGSYGTKKYSVSLNSGLIRDRYVIFGRFSQVKSNGYRQHSWVDFRSFFLGLARFGKKSSTRIHFYGGPVKDGLVYEGLPKFVNDFRGLRRDNLSYWEADKNSYTVQTPRRPDEIENFNQPHLELIHEIQLNGNLKLRNSLFGIRGYGFFDYDGSWAPLSYYRLTSEYGFEVRGDPELQYANQVLIRAYVDNKQAGWLPQLEWNFPQGKMMAGSEFRVHQSLHWGRIQKGSDDLPQANSGNYRGLNYIGSRRYYQYKGAKEVVSPYFHLLYTISPQVSAMLDAQLAFRKYHLFDEEFLHNDFDLAYTFLNPRVGINYRAMSDLSVFTSFSRTSREPRLKTYYDAAEASTPLSWGPVVPQFEVNSDGGYNFNKPLVKPETLNDFEIGLNYRRVNWNANVNLFYMDFKNEIIKKGQVDRFGQPITGNAPRTLHRGLELSLRGNIFQNFIFNGNFTYSKNELKKYSVFNWGGEEVVLNGNSIAGFPNNLANLRLSYNGRSIQASLAMQHVGKQYIDNFENEDNSVAPYTVFNGMFGYALQGITGLRRAVLQIHLQNIFNKLYFTHGYLTFGNRPSFFPAAERQVFVNLKVEL